MGPTHRRLERLSIRGNDDCPVLILVEHLLRNRQRTPAPVMRDRHFGPPPDVHVPMICRRLVEAPPGELHEVRHPGREVLIRFLAGMCLQEVPHDLREVARPR